MNFILNSKKTRRAILFFIVFTSLIIASCSKNGTQTQSPLNPPPIPKPPIVLVKSLTVVQDSMLILQDSSIKLSVTILPDTATNKKLL